MSAQTVKQANTAYARVRLTANGVDASLRIDDSPAARDFLAQLPVKMTLKDYNGTEKIAYLPRKLSARGAPAGVEPCVGDVTYYAPWGNLAIFYKPFGYSEGLVTLGRIESGLDALMRLKHDVTITMERIDTAPEGGDALTRGRALRSPISTGEQR